jgi:hypothetical protein
MVVSKDNIDWFGFIFGCHINDYTHALSSE